MKITPTPIATAVALVLLNSAPVARAQSAPTPPAADKPAEKKDDKAGETQVITVTGIRSSLQKSLNEKRNTDALVEVVTAEDIGKMPDKNVADSLQRVPGVTIGTAGAGEGGFDENDRVSLRGTNPSLTQTLINGHSVGSGDWFVLNQVGTVGRSVSYSLLPAQMVGSVVVQKSSQADLVEGGIAGTVNIRTRRPLDFQDKLTLDAQVGAVYADLPGKTDPQFGALLGWKNDAGTLGVMAQVFSEKRHLRRDGQEMLGYSNRIEPGSPIALSNPDLAGVVYPNAIGSALFEQERERTGALIDVQLKPTNDIQLGLNGFVSHMKATNVNRNFLVWTQSILANGQGQAPAPGYVVKNGTLVSATFPDDGSNRTYGIYDQISRPGAESKTSFVNFDASFRASDRLVFDGQIGTSTGKGDTPEQALFSAVVRGTGASYGLNGMGRPADAALLTGDPSQNSIISALDWIYGASPATTTDKENWAQLDGEFAIDSGVFTALKFGLRFAQHKRDVEVTGQGPLGSTDATDPSSAFNPANFPAWSGGTYPGDFGAGLGSGDFPHNIWQLDTATLDAWGRLYSNRDPVARRNWAAEFALKEDNSALYAMQNVEGKNWSGNFGLRLVQSKLDVLTNIGLPSDTCAVVATCPEPGVIIGSAFGPFYQKSIKNTYNDVLPSANLRYDLQQDLVLRAAIAKTITRPDYSALGGAIALEDNNNTGSGGNPNLKPIRSTNYDLGLEWYFAPRALASAGVFYMDLKNYVSYGTNKQVFRNVRTGQDEEYTITSPINSDGSVKGMELALQMPIGQGFGALANYTYADAKEDGGGPLVGASRDTYNLAGYFENDRFNARLAYTFRSEFFNGLDRSSAQYQDDVGTLAASLGYKFSEKLSLTLDALNLNEPVLKYYANSPDQPLARYVNGRQYYLMLRAKL
jgi:iron complex outermembrane receptor protein